MIAATRSLTTGFYDILLGHPMREGAIRIQRAYDGIHDPALTQSRKMTLGERTISLITGSLLFVPVVGAVMLAFLRTFGWTMPQIREKERVWSVKNSALKNSKSAPVIPPDSTRKFGEKLATVSQSKTGENPNIVDTPEQVLKNEHQTKIDLDRGMQLYVNSKEVRTVAAYRDEMGQLGVTKQDIDRSLHWTHQGFAGDGLTLLTSHLRPDDGPIPYTFGHVNGEQIVRVCVDSGRVSLSSKKNMSILSVEDDPKEHGQIAVMTVLPNIRKPSKYSCSVFRVSAHPIAPQWHQRLFPNARRGDTLLMLEAHPRT